MTTIRDGLSQMTAHAQEVVRVYHRRPHRVKCAACELAAEHRGRR